MSTLKRYLLLKLSKPELDYFSTILGLTATIFTVLTTNAVIDKQLGTTVAGISGGILSILINQPASHAPLTDATEDNLLEEEQERGS